MWYLSSGLKPVGPFTLNDLLTKIKEGHLGLSDLVFNEEFNEWKVAQEWSELRQLGFPALEAVSMNSPEEPIWVVLHKDESTQSFRQQGPFTQLEIDAALIAGTLRWQDLIWKKGLSGWARLNERPEFIESSSD